jgi:DNA helicase-2/ATP-dependent DNA helicase PcrA
MDETEEEGKGIEKLNQEQLVAVELPETRNVQILAGPGTGKTLTLVYRVIRMLKEGVEPEKLLVLTLTNRAIRSFKAKLEESTSVDVARRVALHTFHSFCQGLLVSYGHLIGLEPGWSVSDAKEAQFVMDRAVFGTRYKSIKARNELMEEFRVAKIRAAIDNREPWEYITEDGERDILKRYTKYCRKSSVVDYDDLLILAKQLLLKHRDEMMDLRVVFVDEFQDSTPLQWQIIRLIVDHHECTLTVVGDPDQTIYGFAGSEPKLFEQMHEELDDVETVKLVRNYRSSRQVNEVCQELIHQNPDRLARGDVISHFDGPVPIFNSFSDIQGEAKWIANQVTNLLKEENLHPNDIAILFRTGFSCFQVIAELEAMGQEVAVFRGASLFEQDQVTFLLTVLKFLHNKSQDVYLLYALRYPKYILSEQDCDYAMVHATVKNISLWEAAQQPEEWISDMKYSKKLKKFMDVLKTMDETIRNDEHNPEAIIAALEKFCEHVQLRKSIMRKKHAGPRQLAEIDKFYNLIRYTNEALPTSPNSTALENLLHGYLRYQTTPSDNQIIISTVHAAKGLEWNTVFLAGVDDSNYPHIRTHNNPNEIPEELRVLYVAATRAKGKLFDLMSFSASRS